LQLAQTLAVGMLRNKGLELPRELAMASTLQVRGDPILRDGEPQLLEPADLGLRERLVREVAERTASPEVECAGEGVSGCLGIASRECTAAIGS